MPASRSASRSSALGPDRSDEFVVGREVAFDRRLVAAADDHDVIDPRSERLVDDDLDRRRVTDRHQFLRDGLGRREEPSTQTGGGNDGTTDLHTPHATARLHRIRSLPGPAERCSTVASIVNLCLVAGIFRNRHANLRVQVHRHRRNDRGPAVVQRRHPHRSRPPRERRHAAGQEGVLAGRRHLQGRRVLQDRQPVLEEVGDDSGRFRRFRRFQLVQ